ncbi:MAG: adenosylcobinamide amidohydrolase [Anaerolineales bacterium]|nr:adenosylcobinamide amidohydrolase [Anaerolineales bacterium]
MNPSAFLLQSVTLSQTDQVIHIQSQSPLTTLSSAIVGGGYGRARHILNASVEKNFYVDDPQAWLHELAQGLNVAEPFIGLITAVKLHKARSATFQAEGLTVSAVITAGVGNAASAGITPPFSYRPGTINTILLLDANLTPAAMLNAIITATEAKTATLKERNILAPDGASATGTSTDTVTIACTGAGELQLYAGPVTTIGWLIARAVRQALNESLSAT